MQIPARSGAFDSEKVTGPTAACLPPLKHCALKHPMAVQGRRLSMQAAVALCAVPVWRFVTHAPRLTLHPVLLLRAALGWQAAGMALAAALLQGWCCAAFVQVGALRSR